MRPASRNRGGSRQEGLRSGRAPGRWRPRWLLLALVASLLPAAGFSIWDALRSYQDERAQRELEFVRTARLLVADRHGSFMSALHLLDSLARMPEIRNFGSGCRESAESVLATLQDPAYAAIGAVDANGRWRCGARAHGESFQVGDRQWFDEIRDGRKWAVSEWLDGPTPSARSLVLAVPIRDGARELAGAIGLVVDANRLVRKQHPAALGRDSIFVILDRDGGTIVSDAAAYPSLHALPRDPAVVLRGAAGGRSVLAAGRDGVMRQYAVVPLLGDQLRALAGVTADSVLAPPRTQLARRLLSVAWLVPFACVAWISVDRFYMRWLRRMSSAVRGYVDGSSQLDLPPTRQAPAEVKALANGLAQMTAQIEAREQTCRDQLASQDLLVREVHHRVKNNLQMVMSLLALHARRVPEGEARRGFEDASGRLAALALVHCRLHEATRLEVVDADEFLGELCRDLVGNRPARSRHIDLRVRAARVRLPAETAVPLGLLVHEAVINAYKHAFDGRNHGAIDVSLECTGEDTLRLDVSDDGSGYDPGAARDGLGMTLIAGFARQLGGTLAVEASGGTHLTVVFPGSGQG